ncbi:MAG: trimethylamine methyltransferase family protein, partial [Planctomycetota bacterium]
GGNFLGELSTVRSIRNGEWYLPDFGTHSSYDDWAAGDRKDVFAQFREKVAAILDAYEPLPLGEDVEKELEKICKKARAE